MSNDTAFFAGHHRRDQLLSSTRNRTATLRCTYFSRPKGASATTAEDFFFFAELVRSLVPVRNPQDIIPGRGGGGGGAPFESIFSFAMAVVRAPRPPPCAPLPRVQNPFHQRPNMFDLSAMIAEGRAVVQFDLLAPHVPRHYPQWAAPELSDDLKDFCAQCMTQDAAQRPLCPELLQHPFFQPPTDANSVDFRRWLRDHGVTKSGTGRERGVSNASSSGQQVSPAVDGNSMDRFGSAPDS